MKEKLCCKKRYKEKNCDDNLKTQIVTKLNMWQSSKTQIVTKLKMWEKEIKKFKYDKTQNMKKNSKSHIFTKLKMWQNLTGLNYDLTQKFKLWLHSKIKLWQK